jgi:hypothetical protein
MRISLFLSFAILDPAMGIFFSQKAPLQGKERAATAAATANCGATGSTAGTITGNPTIGNDTVVTTADFQQFLFREFLPDRVSN